MNAIEVVVVMVVVGSGFLAGRWLSSFLGWPGWIAGVPLGGVAGVATLYVATRLLASVERRLWPMAPACRNGRCFAGDYTVVPHGRLGEIRLRCRCGTQYIECGRRLLELLDDGTLRPYMRRTRLGRWVPDRLLDSPAMDERT